MVRLSWAAPESTSIVSPTAKPLTEATLTLVAPAGATTASTSTAPLCGLVVGALRSMPVPLVPAVPTALIVADSRLVPVSIVICWPTEKPVTEST